MMRQLAVLLVLRHPLSLRFSFSHGNESQLPYPAAGTAHPSDRGRTVADSFGGTKVFERRLKIAICLNT